MVAELPGQGRAEVKCLEGFCLLELKKRSLALAAFLEALELDGSSVDALLGCAGVYEASSRFEEALGYLERARAMDGVRREVAAGLARVLTELGTAEKLAGVAGWEARYARALAYDPDYGQAHYNLGVAAGEAGDAAAAEAHYRAAVACQPLCVEAWCNLGVVLRSGGHAEEALEAYERAYRMAPNNDVVRVNLATSLTERGSAAGQAGRVEEAVACYERALALHPGSGEALYNLGVAAMEAGALDRAAFLFECAIRALPRCAEAYNNLGVVHREQGNVERAVACYQAALDARPDFPQGLNNLAVVYTSRGQAREAEMALRAALRLAPGYAEAWNNLGVLQRDTGASAEAVASYERCLALDPDNRNAGQNRLLSLNYVHHGEAELVCAAHRAWGERFQRRHATLPPLEDRDRDPDRPLRVGYVSPDLVTHSVSYFAQTPITSHDRARVHAYVYSCCPREDDKTVRLRGLVAAAGHTWRDVAALSEAALAARIREDRVDVLVELTGHTAHNRLGAVAARPAPIQVTWIGYPNGTGLPSVDYRLTDAVCDPETTAQTFVEELVRLPGCFLCYTPAHDLPDVAPLPALAAGAVTFGSFNALAKETDETLGVWAAILRAVPGSRLVLKNKPFACDSVRERYWRMFEERWAVERHRVDLLPLAPTNSEHMAQYALLDVALDPWPYAGTTTTAEALVMGVPCVTMAGRCHAHCVGRSLLHAVGLPERDWVAHSTEEYVAAAVRAASDLPRLAKLRAGLRTRVLESDLCAGPKFMRQLEEVYRDMWKRWLERGEQRAAQSVPGSELPRSPGTTPGVPGSLD